MAEPRSALLVRLPRGLHRRLRDGARRARVSLNHYCSALLSAEPAQSAPRTDGCFSLAARPEDCSLDLQLLVEGLCREFGEALEGVVLFGSWARGRAGAASDIDLLAAFAEGTEIDRDYYGRWRPPRMGGHEISPLFVQLPNQADEMRGLWLEAALDGIVIFDRRLNVSRYLAHVRGRVARGHVRRMTAQGHPYWVHERIEEQETR